MANNKLAIIGGSGLYDVEEFKDREMLSIDTSWGKPSDQILKTKYNTNEVYFLPRHGRGHFISPSNINFRANIDALKQLGVTDIVSISAVGSLKEDHSPGKFVIVDQFIDRTFARNKTFFDDEIVAHVSMAHPTSNGLMNACEEAIKLENINYQRGGTYVVMEGPQFSTLAESNLYRSWKADVIGMTNMPEAKLAREAEIRYASVSMVTDYDCWHPDHENVDVQQVIKVLLDNAAKAKNMIKNLIKNFENHIDANDPTNNCLDVAKGFGGGADFVMLGGMLAGHDEGKGKLVKSNGSKYIEFYGSSSETANKKHYGGLSDYRSSEGRTVRVKYRGKINDTIKDILGGVRSSCTYVGAPSLKQLSKCTTFVRVTKQFNDTFVK